MRSEISTLAEFITEKLIGDRLPLSQRLSLGRALARLLNARYEGHWHPHDPLLGSGYRAVQNANGRLDLVLRNAFDEAGISATQLGQLMRTMPEDFSVFCDPAEVAVRIGAEGSVWPLDLVQTANPEGHTAYQPPHARTEEPVPYNAAISSSSPFRTPQKASRAQTLQTTPMKQMSGHGGLFVPLTPGENSNPLSNPMAITPAKPGAPATTPCKSIAQRGYGAPHWTPEQRRKGSLNDMTNSVH